MPDEETAHDEAARPLPTTVKALGAVSLFTDLSSEMVYPINPILLRALGASPAAIGLIEGIAESTASILKLFSGALSDRIGRRKPLALAGYGLAALSKPLLGLSGTWTHVLVSRLLDRTGKGLRGAPRDALIADVCPPESRGRAFGLHRTLDTTGAVLGPLIGWAFLRARGLDSQALVSVDSLRPLYFLAFVPALVGVALLAVVVKENRSVEGDRRALPRFSIGGISGPYRRFLAAITIFGLGNSSDAFLLLRAHEGFGVAPDRLLLLYALFNLVEATLGYAAGRLSDRVGRKPLICLGWIVFALVYAGFAWLPGWLPPGLKTVGVAGLLVLYGLYSTLTQGAQKALAADLSDPAKRGAQLGVFHLLVGIAALPASLIAGVLYRNVSPAAPFLVGATGALLAAGCLAATGLRKTTATPRREA